MAQKQPQIGAKPKENVPCLLTFRGFRPKLIGYTKSIRTIAVRRVSKEASVKEVFTTTEAARLCHISKQKIVNLFDEGRIKGFRIPGSKAQARRIPRADLLEFMKTYGIPTGGLEEDVKKRVLIVDDDENSVELFEAMFADEEEFEIRSARNGADAAVLAGSFNPDLILLDIMLPDLDGDEIFKSIRKEESLSKTRVVVVTALSEKEWRDKMMKAGVDAFFTKPINIKRLMKKVKDLVGVT